MARWSLYGVRIDAQDKLTRRKYVSSPTIMGCNMVIEIAEMLSDWGVDELRAKSRSLQLFEPDWTQRIWTFGGTLRDVLEWGKMADDSLLIQSYIGCDWAYILNLDARRFEVYRYFQREPHQRGRYANLPPDSRGEFYPVALIKDWPLDALPKPYDFLQELIAIDPSAAETE